MNFSSFLRNFLVTDLRVPLQRLFYLEWGEFKGIFLADWSGHNEIENLIKMSKVDFEKQIFEKKIFGTWKFFSGCQTGGTLAENFSIFKKKKIRNFIFQNPLLTFLSDFRFRY